MEPVTALGNESPLATLIHVSDLHFGSHFTSDETRWVQLASNLPLVQALLGHSYQAVRALAIRVNGILSNRRVAGITTCVIFTGDLTSRGEKHEFVTGDTFLRSSHCLGAGNFVGLELRGELPRRLEAGAAPVLLCIPGNHDIWKRAEPQMLGVYRESFPGDFPLQLEISTGGRTMIIYGLDSTLNTDFGHKFARGRVPLAQLEALEKCLAHGVKRGAIQFVCLHHPLTDPPNKSFDATMRLEQREMIAKRLVRAGANLVLAGHLHEWFVTQEICNERPAQLVVGTATQQCSPRSFAVADVFESVIKILIFEFDENTCQFRCAPRTWEVPIPRLAAAVSP
jgi:3',5'-cyclic AMP phosphodiesterase CpdA